MTGPAPAPGLDEPEVVLPVSRRGARLLGAVAMRVAAFVATVLGAVLLVEVLLTLAPGDAIDLLPNGDELRVGLAAEWGLDKPLPERLVATLGRMARGDLGTSLTWRPGASVAELVADTGARSLLLLAPALLLGVALAVALGAWSARGGTRLLRLVQAVSVVPAFLAAYVLVMGINAATWALIERGAIARPDWFALPDTPSAVRTALAIGVLAVASGGLTEMHAACDAELRRLRAAPFVDAARARGAPTWPVILHNLVPPLADIAASRAAWLLGSLVVVEKLLLYSGAGAALWQACRLRDYPVAIGITLVAAIVVAGTRLVADLVRLAVDPRLRSAG
ncbi:MAG: ABC transporter permease [Pseudomonadota bacterium]|nr:ABC transporter permease [Pseudomonadota bacterium]